MLSHFIGQLLIGHWEYSVCVAGGGGQILAILCLHLVYSPLGEEGIHQATP